MGLKRYLGVGREVDGYGVAVSASRIIETIAKITPDQGFIISDPICDPSRSKYNLGPFRVKGNVGPFDAAPDNIGEFINGAMGHGNPTNSTYTAANQTNDASRLHTWLCGNDLDSYTLRIGAEIEERILTGMLVNSLTLKASHGEDLQCTVAWVGPGAAEDTGELQSFTRANLTSAQPFVYHQAAGTLEIDDGDKSANIFDLEVNIENNIPVDRGNLNSRFMPVNRRGGRAVTGKFSCFFDDDDEYDRFMAGTYFELDLKFVGPLIDEDRYYTLELLMPRCVYLRDSAHPIQPMDEPLAIDVPFQAFYDDGTYTELQVILENQLTDTTYCTDL